MTVLQRPVLQRATLLIQLHLKHTVGYWLWDLNLANPSPCVPQPRCDPIDRRSKDVVQLIAALPNPLTPQ